MNTFIFKAGVVALAFLLGLFVGIYVARAHHEGHVCKCDPTHKDYHQHLEGARRESQLGND